MRLHTPQQLVLQHQLCALISKMFRKEGRGHYRHGGLKLMWHNVAILKFSSLYRCAILSNQRHNINYI